MTFEKFLIYVREEIGRYCTDAYWRMIYNDLPEYTIEYIKHETPFLAVHAVATDYASKNG